MSDKSGIIWTDATLNPVFGCTKCSPGCLNCFAERMAYRLACMGQKKYQEVISTDGGVWNNKVICDESTLDKPLHWKQPRKIFICSMADLFHPKVPFDFIDSVAMVIGLATQHTYQLLTKRPGRALAYRNRFVNRTVGNNIFQNHVHLGVSICTPDELHKADTLREIPAAVRFINFEPLLLDMGKLNLTGIDWVIVGGESGPNARPMHPDWVRGIRDQCIVANVPFFFKQWGAWGIAAFQKGEKQLSLIGDSKPLSRNTIFRRFPEHIDSTIPCIGWVRVGKKKAGCLLDGREWKQWPRDLRVQEKI